MPLVLMYHALLTLPASAAGEERTLVVDPADFRWQLDELARAGFRSLTLEEVGNLVAGGDEDPRAVLITFDDAYRHVLETATTLLEELGFTAVMFAPWGHLGGVNDWDSGPSPVRGLQLAGPEELAAAAAGPWEIASHGTRHVDLRAVPPDERLEDLVVSRQALSTLAGREVVELAYPYGLHDDEVRDAAREAGYRIAFTAGRAPAGGPLALPRRTVRGQEGRTAFRIGLDAELRQLFR